MLSKRMFYVTGGFSTVLLRFEVRKTSVNCPYMADKRICEVGRYY